MTLATRCPKCSTTFRIVPDQLKISEGLVRCGKCQHVFNARQYQINPLPLTAEHEEEPPSKTTGTPSKAPHKEEKKFSELLEDSKFIDSLFSEFQIGWADTVIDYRSAENTSFSKALAQSKGTEVDEEDPDEIIELDDTEFTESLMRLDDTSYDISEMLVVEDDDDELLTSELFADSLAKNLSLGPEDTILAPDTPSEAAISPSAQEKPEKVKEKVEAAEPAFKQNINTIIPSGLSVLPDAPDEEAWPSNFGTSKPIIIPPVTDFSSDDWGILPEKTVPPVNLESTAENPDKTASSKEKEHSKKRKGKSIAEYSEAFANTFSISDTLISDDSENDATVSTQISHLESDFGASNLSSYNNSTNFSTTRLNEKYEKISSSLQEQQLANLSFVQQKRSLWEAPIVKAGMVILILALLTTLIAQTVHYRNYIVSYFPSIRPALVMIAKPLGLSVDYPISFDLYKNITIDASSLNTMPDGSYQLEVIIRNRNPYAVAVPHLELTLQNVSGEVIARKVFSPAELGINQAAIMSQKELIIRRTFTANTQGVAGVGYSTDLFYL